MECPPMLERERVRQLIGTRRIQRVVTIPGRLVSIALAEEEPVVTESGGGEPASADIPPAGPSRG